MKSLVIKRSIFVNGRKTSISIEDPLWLALKEIAQGVGKSLSELMSAIQIHRGPGSGLSSATRVYILTHFKNQQQRLTAVVRDVAARAATLPSQY